MMPEQTETGRQYLTVGVRRHLVAVHYGRVTHGRRRGVPAWWPSK